MLVHADLRVVRGGCWARSPSISRPRAVPTPLQQDLIAQVTHIASIAIERAQSEAALKRSEAFLAEGQRLSLTGSFSWRVATDEITWSEQLYRIYEIEIGTPVTLDLIRTRVHPEDVSSVGEDEMATRHEAPPIDFEWQYRLLMPDHSVKYLHASRPCDPRPGRATRSTSPRFRM